MSEEIDWEADSFIAEDDKELSRGPCKVRVFLQFFFKFRRLLDFLSSVRLFHFVIFLVCFQIQYFFFISVQKNIYIHMHKYACFI